MHDVIAACVPTLGYSDLLPDLVRNLMLDVDQVWVYVNKKDRLADVMSMLPDVASLNGAQPGTAITVISMTANASTLHEVWADAVEMAAGAYDWLAILNDDITLDAHACSSAVALAETMDPTVAVVGFDYRERTERALRYTDRGWRSDPASGGIPGHAFMVRPDRVRVDTQFEIWYGDDAIFRNAILDGHRLAVAEGVHVAHPQWETTVSRYPELEEAKDRDRHRWYTHYGDTVTP